MSAEPVVNVRDMVDQRLKKRAKEVQTAKCKTLSLVKHAAEIERIYIASRKPEGSQEWMDAIYNDYQTEIDGLVGRITRSLLTRAQHYTESPTRQITVTQPQFSPYWELPCKWVATTLRRAGYTVEYTIPVTEQDEIIFNIGWGPA